MSDISYLGRRMRSFQSSPQFDGYSRVVIVVSDELEYSAGVETGRTLTLENPWGTQQMANNLLAEIQGFQYQPYTATDAFLDPAAELGDAVTANNMHGGIYTQKIKFGPLLASTVSAPEDEELDHEYPYKAKQERKIVRENRILRASLAVQSDRITAEVQARAKDVADLTAKLQVQADNISAEVTARQKDVQSLTAKLQVQANEISAKVSKTGGSASSFGWTLNDFSWVIKANSREILKATKSGLEVYGKITATSGKIGGFDIKSNYLSYNSQTWGGTNATGIYLGVSGIQLGKNFKVDSQGNLTANSGTFKGTVRAGNIQYGGDAGYFSGGGLSYGSIYGNRLVGNTITTAYTSGGINSSLARADAAYNVCFGNVKASALSASALAGDTVSGTTAYISSLYLGGAGIYLGTIQDADGSTRRVVMWRN